MEGCTVQTGRIQPACFRLAQPLWAGGPAQRNRARALSQRQRWRWPVQMVWFEKNKNCLNLKFKPTILHGWFKLTRISSKLSKYSDARGVVVLPPNRNLVPRFGRSNGSNGHSEQLHHSSLWQDEVWMSRTEEVFTFPCCFFFRVVAPLYLEELDCFSPWDTILLIQDLDRVLGVQQVSLGQCYFRQYEVHRCLQTLLQL
jgi:hypothetical protein